MSAEKGTKGMIRRVMVITGATGGIGSAVSDRLADSETALFLHGFSRPEELKAKGAALRKISPFVETFQADLSKEEDQNDFFNAFTHWVDAFPADSVRSISWIHAAGKDLMTPEMRGLSFEERLRRMITLDLTAPVRLSKLFGEWLIDRIRKGRGFQGTIKGTGEGEGKGNGKDFSEFVKGSDENHSVIFFGWDGVSRGMEGETAQLYAICKGGIGAFAKSFAQEVAPFLRVLTVSPGWIATRWGTKASEKMNRRVRFESLSDRWGRPEEVADLVAFLVSDKATYLNGVNLEINGGFDFRHSE